MCQWRREVGPLGRRKAATLTFVEAWNYAQVAGSPTSSPKVILEFDVPSYRTGVAQQRGQKKGVNRQE